MFYKKRRIIFTERKMPIVDLILTLSKSSTINIKIKIYNLEEQLDQNHDRAIFSP